MEGLTDIIFDGIVDVVIDKASDGLKLCCDEGERYGLDECSEGLLSIEKSNGKTDGVTDVDVGTFFSSCSNKMMLLLAAASAVILLTKKPCQ